MPTHALSVCALALLLSPALAHASGLGDVTNQWLPDSNGAKWTYEWSDSAYSPAPTRETYTMSQRQGNAFELSWTTAGQGNSPYALPGAGLMDFQRSNAGLVNQSWTGTVPPSQFPILCADASGCGNSLAGAFYMLIWGSRSPVVLEPLVRGLTWNSVGGVNSDVASTNRYVGRTTVLVPAFPRPVSAAEVQSDVTQGGALGDPYGSGTRTVWWVRGVGPVKITFRHAGGELQQADLVSTNLKPLALPPDANYLPLDLGSKSVYRWKNSKHMRKWSRQSLTVGQSVNGTVRVDVKSISGLIKVAGSYVLSSRLDGITELSASTSAALRAHFPGLGPLSVPKSRRRHFFTPLDFMAYGFNPILQAYPEKGQVWKSSKSSRDYKIFGVTGSSKVVGLKKVRTPAGRFDALEVVSTLTQRGVRFGSGTRRSYFAPGKGLVKLTFRHRDGSVSTIERVR
jgi:hypothetical protein